MSEHVNINDEELTQILDYLSKLSVPNHITKDGAWENIHQILLSDSMQEAKEEFTLKRFVFRLSVAALLLIGLSTYYFFSFFTFKNYHVDRGIHKSVFLPDGSLIKINAESYVSYNSYHWYKNRKVTLNGEAYFEVQHGSPFTVICNSHIITVLGTTFNVYSRKNNFKVECISGQVKVSDDISKKEQVITTGKAVSKSEDSVMVVDIKSEQSASWIRGEFYYNGERLDHVFQEIERQYRVKIICTDVSSRIYSGYFNNSDLKKTMDVVCLPMKLNYRIMDNNTIVVQ